MLTLECYIYSLSFLVLIIGVGEGGSGGGQIPTIRVKSCLPKIKDVFGSCIKGNLRCVRAWLLV